MKIIIFCNFAGHFCPPGSGSGYRSTDLIKSGSKTLPLSRPYLPTTSENLMFYSAGTINIDLPLLEHSLTGLEGRLVPPMGSDRTSCSRGGSSAGNLTQNSQCKNPQCWGSVTFWCGSGSAPLTTGSEFDSFLQWLWGCKKNILNNFFFI